MRILHTISRGLVAFLLLAAVVTPVLAYEVWTERQPAGDVDGDWRVASDADGSALIVGNVGGRLYTSINSGAAWTERQPAGDVTADWFAVASDADGSFLVAGINNGRLYTSSDSGASWTERQPAGDTAKAWSFAAVDATGTNLFVGATSGRLYTSSNGGVSWTERQPIGDTDGLWLNGDMTPDGSKLLVGGVNSRLYASTNGGASWSEYQPAGDTDKFWRAFAMDDDGSHIIAAVNNGRVYTSSNSGADWTERQPAGDADKSWFSVASDADGSFLLAAVNDNMTGGRLYSSSNGGVSWTERQPDGDADYQWRSVATDSDGSHSVAGILTGRLYTAIIDETNPTLSTVSPVDNATGVSTTANLVLTFDEAVDVETGNITIKKTADDSTVEAIDVTGGLVTGSGSTEITVNPTAALAAGTEYYVLIAATAFDDVYGNSYAGIASTTAWSFTTATASSGGTNGGTAPPAPPTPTSENPTGEFRATLASGSEVTMAREVSLLIEAGNNIRYMSVSEDPNFIGADMVSYTPSSTVTLSAGYERKTVYVRLFALSGQSVTVSDSITLTSPKATYDEEITKPPVLPPRERVILPRAELAKILPIATPVDGLVKLANDPAVYYIGLDGKRHPFASGRAFETWGLSFDQVKTVSETDLASVPLGNPVLERPGSRWVKIQSDPKTYFVDPDGYTLRWIQDEDAAKQLGGEDWNKNIVDVEPTYFTKYQMGEAINTESLKTSWPKGSLVKTPGETTVWFITKTGRRQITSTEAFKANQFQEVFVKTTPLTAGWLSLPVEAPITEREDALTSEQYL